MSDAMPGAGYPLEGEMVEDLKAVTTAGELHNA
jgi:hypothetical protein